MKMSTKQAIRESLKKKKGKKSNKSKGLDASNSDKPNDSNKIGIKGKKGRKKPVVPNNVTTRNDSECQVTLPVLPEILNTKAKMSEIENVTIDNNLDNQEPSGISIEDRKEKCVIKEKMTLKELKFLELYLTDGMTIDSAMIAAGYGHVSKIWRYNLAKRIILKHECRAGDHRKIFRIIGAGETTVAMGLLTLAQTAKSEMVRLNAWASLAKILGLTKEVLEQAEGIQIIINQGCVTAGEDDQPAVLDLPKAPPPSSGTLQITK